MSESSRTPEVHAFLHDDSHTLCYVVRDPASDRCAIIDSVLDFDYAAGRVGYEHAGRVAEFVRERQWQVDWLIETHVHADHLSAAPWLQRTLGGQIGIGADITAVQTLFGRLFHAEPAFRCDGSQFNRLFADGARYFIGGLEAYTMHTPGHTPACMTHVIGDAVFVGDTLFMPDSGSARADFPGGDAGALYHSMRRILSLPPEFRVFVCHDYGCDGGREIRWETTIAEQRAHNIHIRDGMDADTYIDLRTRRDATLATPRLLLPSIQVNMRAGHLPPADDNGRHYLRVPIEGYQSP